MSGGWRRVVAIAVPVVAVLAIGAWLWTALNPSVVPGPFAGPRPDLTSVPEADGRSGTWALAGTTGTVVQSLRNDGRAPITVEAGGQVGELTLTVVFQPEWSGPEHAVGAPEWPTVPSVTVAPGDSVGVVITITAPPCAQRSLDGAQVVDGLALRVRSLGLTTDQWLPFDGAATVTVLGRPACSTAT